MSMYKMNELTSWNTVLLDKDSELENRLMACIGQVSSELWETMGSIPMVLENIKKEITERTLDIDTALNVLDVDDVMSKIEAWYLGWWEGEKVEEAWNLLYENINLFVKHIERHHTLCFDSKKTLSINKALKSLFKKSNTSDGNSPEDIKIMDDLDHIERFWTFIDYLINHNARTQRMPSAFLLWLNQMLSDFNNKDFSTKYGIDVKKYEEAYQEALHSYIMYLDQTRGKSNEQDSLFDEIDWALDEIQQHIFENINIISLLESWGKFTHRQKCVEIIDRLSNENESEIVLNTFKTQYPDIRIGKETLLYFFKDFLNQLDNKGICLRASNFKDPIMYRYLLENDQVAIYLKADDNYYVTKRSFLWLEYEPVWISMNQEELDSIKITDQRGAFFQRDKEKGTHQSIRIAESKDSARRREIEMDAFESAIIEERKKELERYKSPSNAYYAYLQG